MPQAEGDAGHIPRAIIPRATYRLQLNAQFTLRDATALIPYLAELGVSHVYCSPYFRARPGSMHGYDVVDHNSLNPEIGTLEDLDRFVAALRAHEMGHILDIVPNHVGVMGADNARWMDVLENGQASRYAPFFDIDWQPPNPALAGRLLVPVLGDAYGAVLERGELQLRFAPDSGSFATFYHEHRFPLDPRTYPRVLEQALALLARGVPRGTHDIDPRIHQSPAESMAPSIEFERLIEAFRNLPDRETRSPVLAKQRDADKETHKKHLAVLAQRTPLVAEAIQAAVASLCGTPGDPPTFDALHDLLEQQAYRLSSWRVASDDLNYRRFFDINDLAALQMQNEAVFEATHRFTLALVRERKVDGLRIDHPDGLYDPAEYFHRLQDHAAEIAAVASAPRDGRPGDLPLYLLVEKITAGFEHLPESWPVHGTTGYRFTNVVNGLFVDSRAKARMDRIYRGFIGDYLEWTDVAYESKALILRTALAAELNVLANQLARIAQTDRRTRDFTLSNLRHALIEVIAWFPVYRTYVAQSVSEEDRRYIEWAVSRARRRSSATNAPLFDFVSSVLLADVAVVSESRFALSRAFAMKFQQVTAPVTAKGVEDTALYRFTRLASLNEVGGEPETFGVSVRQFHADSRYRARKWPHEMLATSTHDTKRAEDTRARIDVLSEFPTLWRKSLQRWGRMNRARRHVVDDQPAPGPHAEYLLYQTLLGTWPLGTPDDAAFADYRERIEDYMVKAMREAKRRTSWSNVNAEYEEALRQFLRVALERREGNAFPSEVAQLARRIARFGFLNGLAQTLCKLTAPGVPDIYQGNETWDFSLVDPDNRRPVNYAQRRHMLADMSRLAEEASTSTPEQLRSLLSTVEDGRCKLYLTWKTLRFRRSHPSLFRDGEYLPLRTTGEHASHLCAYARRRGGELAVVVVPRLCARLLEERAGFPLGRDVWADTAVEMPARHAEGTLQSILDGGGVSIAKRDGLAVLLAGDAFAHFPVALLS